MPRKKCLLIGINYNGSNHQLKGCINDAMNVREFLVRGRGYSPDQRDMVILTDAPENRGTPFYPTGANMLAAFHWLITGNNPGDSLWLSYSGHGNLTTLSVLWISNRMDKSQATRLTILFDCCHSGSAVELSYVFRPDADGRVNMVNNVKQGISLAKEASDLLRGGFSMEKIHDVQSLIGRGSSLFHKITHPEAPSDENGLADENFVEDWRNEGKDVWMFSGCADDQTSADTSMQGLATGAMSWAFINTMRHNPRQSYIQVLQSTRGMLQDKYSQIPQLSVGGKYDLNQPVYV